MKQKIFMTRFRKKSKFTKYQAEYDLTVGVRVKVNGHQRKTGPWVQIFILPLNGSSIMGSLLDLSKALL